jgi:hypothetical protein
MRELAKKNIMNEIIVFLVNVDKQDDLADAAGINSM